MFCSDAAAPGRQFHYSNHRAFRFNRDTAMPLLSLSCLSFFVAVLHVRLPCATGNAIRSHHGSDRHDTPYLP